MYHACELISENFLRLVYLFILERAKSVNLIHRQEREQSQAFLYVCVVYISPILVELIRRSFFGVEPKRAGFGLAHFFAVALQKQSERHAKRCFLLLTANKVCACEYITPLIVSAHLQSAAVFTIELEEIVRLHKHVVELEESKTFLHSALVAFCRKHSVY